MGSKRLTIPALTTAAVQMVARRIYFVRGQKVMLDQDLAEPYDVSTKAFNQAIKRNRTRFPADFMFQLTAREANIAVMRAFVSLREMAASYANLARKLGALERRCDTHDHHIKLIFDTLRTLIREPARPRHRMGFVSQERPVIS